MNPPFTRWESRDRVAARLESIVRAQGDPSEVIAELDRMDAVNRAKERLTRAKSEWNAEQRAAGVKIEDAPKGATCHTLSYPSYGWRQTNGTTHKAKYLLNGTPYCGTHLKRAQGQAEFDAIRYAKTKYVPNAADQAIVRLDEQLRQSRPTY